LTVPGSNPAAYRLDFVVPLPGFDIEEEGSGSVRVVGGVDAAVGEAVEQPGVDGTEAQIFRRLYGRNVVEHPAQLRRGEVRAEGKSSLRADAPDAVCVPRHFVTQSRCPFVFPNQGGMKRLTRSAVPNDASLTLIGYAPSKNRSGGFTDSLSH